MEMVWGPGAGPVDESDLAAAYPWPDERSWVRAMMLTTLDGAVKGADGRSGSISSPADRVILAEVRRLADAVVIGGGTLRAERYRPMRARPEAVAERSRLGLDVAPVLVVVSASLDLPWDDEVWTGSDVRPIVATAEAADADLMAVARSHADVLVLPGGSVDPVQLVEALVARGLRRIVCEGGPRLLAEVATAGLLDEADISIAPLIVGGGQVAVPVPPSGPRRFALAHAIHHEGFLFNRYVAESGAVHRLQG
jgi:riboflavin biosynthesis pyrimidine reductase